MLTLDTSCINWDLAKKKRMITLSDKDLKRRNWHVNEPGSESARDFLLPPGHPAYFLSAVRTRYDHDALVRAVLVAPDGTRYIARYKSSKPGTKPTKDSLYIPLPLDNERVQKWIRSLYTHFHHCYANSVYWPVGRWHLPLRPERKTKAYFLGIGQEEVTASEESYQNALKNYRRQVKAILATAWETAKDPSNHLAVQAIRRYYPDYQPDMSMIRQSPHEIQADWIYMYAQQPEPHECPKAWRHVPGKYCTFCGAK